MPAFFHVSLDTGALHSNTRGLLFEERAPLRVEKLARDDVDQIDDRPDHTSSQRQELGDSGAGVSGIKAMSSRGFL